MWTGIRRFFRDAYFHLIPGTICLLRRRHRDLVPIGAFKRKGFREIPLYQCRRCFDFYVTDHDAKRVGGLLDPPIISKRERAS